jgi:hypothetical protein
MNQFLKEHPTGIGTAIAAFLFALNQDNGWLYMSEETSIIGVGAVAALISLFTPRFRTN